MNPTFGFAINQEEAEPRASAGAEMSVVGLVGTAPAAVAATFPLNTPVLIYSNDTAALTALGATGTLPDAVKGVDDQLGEFQSAAKIVIVRVEEGEDDDATIANLVGAAADSSGLYALKAAAAALGVTPRLIGVPGYTQQHVAPAANAVCAALPAILDSLLGVAAVDGPNTTQAAAEAWRETLSSKRLIPVEGGAEVLVGGVATAVPLAPRILGLAVAIDHANNGRPFRSWANRAIKGILGPARNIAFSLTDDAVEGQALLAKQIGILVRGEGGVDTAIADGGFVYIGTDNVGDDDLWRFYHQVRGRDYIHLTFLRALRFFLGRFNLTGQAIAAVMNTMKIELRDRQTAGDILGFKVAFLKDQNQPDNLRAGRVSIRFAAEEAPVLRQVTLQSARYRAALDDLLENLAGQSAA